jgi:5-methylcytosine-specific restriction enzyme A
MPRAPRPCPHDGCTALIHGDTRRCPEHQPTAWSGPRTQSSVTTSSGAWKQLRLHVLKRDHDQCQLQLPGCIGRATQVDHIVNVANGGPEFDPNNCQASCSPCNARKASAEGAAARARRKAQRPKPSHPGLIR